MLYELPHPVWIQLMNHLGFYNMCFIRNVSKSVKDRVDDTMLQVYNKIQGKNDTFMTNNFETEMVFPVINLNQFNDRKNYYNQIKKIVHDYQNCKLRHIIVDRNLFKNYLHEAKINNIDFIKLKKALRLIILGLSEHYTIKTMDLDYKKIDNTIKLKAKNICDLFCYRGGVEFNDYQINNFIRLKEHTYQDCFTFVGAMRLNNDEIDKTLEYKKDGLLDYYALEKAGCENLFEKSF
jgi:hypothetical protein